MQIKRDLLELVKEYYVPLGKELVPCIPALITSIMPMVEENEEDIKKTMDEIIQELKNVKKYFIGIRNVERKYFMEEFG